MPGVIGTVGTILGDAKANIDDMVVGRTEHRCRRAHGAVHLDAGGDDVVAEALRGADGIIDARAIDLD